MDARAEAFLASSVLEAVRGHAWPEDADTVGAGGTGNFAKARCGPAATIPVRDATRMVAAGGPADKGSGWQEFIRSRAGAVPRPPR